MNFIIYMFIAVVLALASSVMLYIYYKGGNEEDFSAIVIGFIVSAAFIHTAIQSKRDQ